MPLVTKNVDKLYRDGCQITPTEVLLGLMATTNDDPCTTGCAFFNGGQCSAYRLNHSDILIQPVSLPTIQQAMSASLISGQWAGKGLKQIAKELGISQNEAQRRRDAGVFKT